MARYKKKEENNMKTTLERAVSAAQIMNRLNGIRMKSSATARKIFTLTEELKPNLDFYINEERKLIEELGGAVSENGTILFSNQEEGIQKLKAGREELLKTEVDIPIDPPVIFRDSEGLPVAGEEIGILKGIAEFKE
jgi:hypothetical protein